MFRCRNASVSMWRNAAETPGRREPRVLQGIKCTKRYSFFNRAIKFPPDSRVRETAKNYCKTIYLAAG